MGIHICQSLVNCTLHFFFELYTSNIHFTFYQLYLDKNVKKKKRLYVYLFRPFSSSKGYLILFILPLLQLVSFNCQHWGRVVWLRMTKHFKYSFSPFPSQDSFPPSFLYSWYLQWTYQSCLCQQHDHNSKRKHRKSFSGPPPAGEVFLGPPLALQHSRAQSPSSLPGQRWEKWELSEASCWSQQRNSRRIKERRSWGSGQRAYKDEQNSIEAASLPVFTKNSHIQPQSAA